MYLQPHPLGSAVGEVLVLPDRYLCLDRVDEVPADGERLCPVRGGDDRDQCDVADLKVTDAVSGDDIAVRGLSDPRAHVDEDSFRVGVRLGRVSLCVKPEGDRA